MATVELQDSFANASTLLGLGSHACWPHASSLSASCLAMPLALLYLDSHFVLSSG